MRQMALDAMARVGVHIDPDKKVENCRLPIANWWPYAAPLPPMHVW